MIDGPVPLPRTLVPFALEDFFDTYEHQGKLVNLASSDAQAWSLEELRQRGVALPHDSELLTYPDVKSQLADPFVRFCQPEDGMGVLPTSGAAEAIALVMHELSFGQDDGRPVAIPRPGFGAFSGLASMLGLRIETYDYHPSRGWAVDPSELLALSERCRAVIVVNPHNPTGHVIAPDELAKMASALSANGGTLIVNEVYRMLGEPSAGAAGRNVTVIGSFSKTYGLPGLRLGWIVTNEKRLGTLRTIQQYLSLSPTSYTVKLGAAIVDNAGAFTRKDLVRKNRGIVTEWAGALDGVTISRPAGGTIVCMAVDVRVDEGQVFDALLEEGVLLVPGKRCFGFGPGVPWFRVGYGSETATLTRGLDRIGCAIDRLSRTSD